MDLFWIFLMPSLVVAVITLILCIGAIILQVYLSKRENKWFGLILPAITFLLFFLPPYNIEVSSGDISMSFLLQVLLEFLLANIPTVILLAVYFICRGIIKRKKRLGSNK